MLGAFGAFSIVEHATWITAMIFAYERGGVGESGLAAFGFLVPSGIIAALIAPVFARHPPANALGVALVVQTTTCAIASAALLFDAPVAVIYATMLSVMIALPLTRPAMAGCIPALTVTVADLTAANAAAGFLAALGLFAGPALSAIVLAWGSAGWVFAIAALMSLAGSGMALLARPNTSSPVAPEAVRRSDSSLEAEGHAARPNTLNTSLGAGADLATSPFGRRSAGLLVGFLTLIVVITGALDVAFAAIAVERLERDESAAGVLAACLGLGALVGATITFALIGSRRLTVPLAIGVCAAGLPIALVAASDRFVLTAALLFLSGMGDAIADIAGRTMLQGLLSDDRVGRIFSLLEGATMIALAVGALGFAALIVAIGLVAALLVLGALLPMSVLLGWRRLRGIDESRPVVDPELLRFFRSVDMFAPLAPYEAERLLIEFETHECAPNTLLFERGDSGSRFFIVADGSVVIERLDSSTVELVAGDCFGEIALLHDVPRTAGATAGASGLRVFTLERDTFLGAVSGSARVRSRSVDLAAGRLAEDVRRSASRSPEDGER